MNRSEVQIGATYLVKVAGNLVPVKITHEHPSGGGGWEGTSVKTGKTIRIKTAQRLRKRLGDVPGVSADPDTATHAAKAEPKRDTGDPVATGSQGGGKEAKTERRMSLLDAAARVLAESGEPLNTKEMVERVVERGLWTPGSGKTPAATLYSSILRETNKKGDEARFAKVERGRFEAKKGA